MGPHRCALDQGAYLHEEVDVYRSTNQIEMQVTIIKYKLPGRLLYNSHLLHFFKWRFLSAGLSNATAPVNDALTCDDINIQFPENENPVDKPASSNKDENYQN